MTKNTKFFLSLEKRNYKNKTITSLENNNKITEDPDEIAELCKNYYEKLYSSRDLPIKPEDDDSNTFFEHIPSLTTEQKYLCEGKLSSNECLKALKDMKNGKTPGLDGFTAEFYKFFWVDIKDIVIDSLNYAFDSGMLSLEQKRGVITLVPKKDKTRLLLKNWRPISLLNTDYKILTKSLAARLEKVLPHLINEDQSGCMKGRYIGDNVRTVLDLIDFTRYKNMPAILLLIDFEKAFDSISWSYIDKTLKAFNFGDSFQRWIKTIYNHISSTVINNGHMTPFFELHRGIRQGCPLSAYIFILCAETLAAKIRANPTIRGIIINNREFKISQFADDTACFVKDTDSVREIISTLQSFQKCSGLKANLEKTHYKCLGSLINTQLDLNDLVQAEGPITYLGITIGNTEEETYKLNLTPKINKLTEFINIWSQRSLSLKGKITVINSLLLPQLIYVVTILSSPSETTKVINDLLFKFLWSGKPQKIAKDIITNKIEEGGLKMPDIDAKFKSLALTWITRAFKNQGAGWRHILESYIPLGSLEYIINSRPNRASINFYLPHIYKQALEYWHLIHHEPENILAENLWYNPNVNINNALFSPKTWYDKGLRTVSDILDNNLNYFSADQLRLLYGVECSFLHVLSLRQALPYEWRKIITNRKCSPLSATPKHHIFKVQDTFIDMQKAKCKDFYWFFQSICKTKINKKPPCIQKWTALFPIEEESWKIIFKAPFYIIAETWMQTFQYKIIHRIFPTNKLLFIQKIKPSPLCPSCGVDDTIYHYFVSCQKTVPFWNSFVDWWNSISIEYRLDPLRPIDIIFGCLNIENEVKCLDYCILIGKYYIYQTKKNNRDINLYMYLVELKSKLTIEKFISEKNDKLNQFETKWSFIYDYI